MRRWLENLQHRPKSYRQRFAFGGAMAVTGVIMTVWLVSLPERFAELAQTSEESPVTDDEVQGFLAGVRDQVAAVGATFTSLRTADTPANESGGREPATATTTRSATSSPSVVVPTLSSSTVRQLNPRPVRIATSSATSS